MLFRRIVGAAGLSLILRTVPGLAQCTSVVSGVPADSANNSAGVFGGEALGQTFLAEALLIESITVWRVPGQAGYVWGMHLYINPTDSLGGPDVSHMLLDGPTVFNTDGDGTTPTPFEFVFDPPFQLPKLGIYEFAVQSDPCAGLWDILTFDNEGFFPFGALWAHSRSSGSSCPLRKFPARYPASDLCFEVRYCDIATPTRQSSWGRLKTLYR